MLTWSCTTCMCSCWAARKSCSVSCILKHSRHPGGVGGGGHCFEVESGKYLYTFVQYDIYWCLSPEQHFCSNLFITLILYHFEKQWSVYQTQLKGWWISAGSPNNRNNYGKSFTKSTFTTAKSQFKLVKFCPVRFLVFCFSCSSLHIFIIYDHIKYISEFKNIKQFFSAASEEYVKGGKHWISTGHAPAYTF